jgi:hypothetical protein
MKYIHFCILDWTLAADGILAEPLGTRVNIGKVLLYHLDGWFHFLRGCINSYLISGCINGLG